MPPEDSARTAGFVLAGGMSRRMGKDKALLPFRGATLLEHAASSVREAAGSVIIVGPPERYAHFGFPVLPDERPGCGPLGGITSAVAAGAEWSLVVACDLPNLTAAFLRILVEAALAEPSADCLVPENPDGLQPLCAVWRASALPKLRCALDARRLKMKDVVGTLDARVWRTSETSAFRNVNTPQDWAI